jgi:hypothetical protein
MARASIRVDLGEQGATLRVFARQLRDMDDAKVTGIFRDYLEPVAKRFVPLVEASVLAIPTTGKKHTGLRGRIAACAETATWEKVREVNVAVEMNAHRMPEHEKGLPLYMEGIHTPGPIDHARWRHPVFGRSEDPWEQQPSHPYFYQAVAGYGPAAGQALRAAVDDISRKITG